MDMSRMCQVGSKGKNKSVWSVPWLHVPRNSSRTKGTFFSGGFAHCPENMFYVNLRCRHIWSREAEGCSGKCLVIRDHFC